MPNTHDKDSEGLIKNPIYSNRIPKNFFITKGKGESNNPMKTVSFHIALHDAGIEKTNIMTYSSVLPSIASQIEKPKNIVHGEVMDTILAVAHGKKGERISAGIIYGWLIDKKTNKKYGGLVSEHYGNISEQQLKKDLKESLIEIFNHGFEKKYTLNESVLITKSFIPEKEYGAAIVALCFTNHLYRNS